MLQSKEQSEPLRYERKFLIEDHSYLDIEQILKFHPACFTEIYYSRVVNNIYFDTLGFNNYYDNVEGSTDRLKVRIRWYGELFGNISDSILEYKLKKGLLGKKDSYRLMPFQLNGNFNRSEVLTALNSVSIPRNIKNEVISLYPTLLNSYSRKYFLSADKKFRITVDHNLAYYRIGYFNNTFLNSTIDRKSSVLELKYDAEFETEAKAIGIDLPFMLTKNSKYLQGLERIVL